MTTDAVGHGPWPTTDATPQIALSTCTYGVGLKWAVCACAFAVVTDVCLEVMMCTCVQYWSTVLALGLLL